MTLTVDAAHQGDSAPTEPGVSKWVDNVLGGYHRYRSGDTWSPAVDIYESRDDFYVIADLAGIDVASIAIRTKGRMLTITGSRPVPQLPSRRGKVRMHVMEIDQGPFERTVEIPGRSDPADFEAILRCGLLWIRLPKRS